MKKLLVKKWRDMIMMGLLSGGVVLLAGCSALSARTEKGATPKPDVSAQKESHVTTEAGIEEKEGAKLPSLPKSIALSLGEIRNISAALQDFPEISQMECDNGSILKILEGGLVYGIAPGTAHLTIQAGTQNYQTEVKVKKRGMVYPSFSMMQKEVLDLQFSSGKKAADYDWTTTDARIAKVTADGRIKAKAVGTAVVTGIARDKSDAYRCEVTVTKRIEKAIYLTFDDGPNRYSTPKVLDILKENGVKATFFELKPAKKDFDLTERVLKERHTLAMHGYQHKYDQIYKSEKTYHENLDKLQELFFDKFGVWCTLTRFPGGSSNMVSSYNPGIMTRLTGKLDGWGYHYFDWNVSSGDAGEAISSNQVYRNFKRELSKDHASVVLMHDFYKNDKTINALNRIIKYGKKHGYTFLPLTASTDEIHHKVNN